MINRQYERPIRVEELADAVNMSVSAFHKHFKRVTAMSPLQYQKTVRLQEAKRLMLSEAVSASEAAFRVGYESPSQFSREYARLYGRPPMQDVQELREAAASGAGETGGGTGGDTNGAGGDAVGEITNGTGGDTGGDTNGAGGDTGGGMVVGAASRLE
ncbi:helix-turn-helix transcriptional regulator [Cohnella rhizosphaerae]|uniref:helix-turn-helix transcriptional regulator n=1 Tax=Cohnella rhizosphaerae TaxID=1457232 RepID=UPI003B8A5FE5